MAKHLYECAVFVSTQRCAWLVTDLFCFLKWCHAATSNRMWKIYCLYCFQTTKNLSYIFFSSQTLSREHSIRLVETHCGKYLEMFADCIKDNPHTWQMDCEPERKKLAKCAETKYAQYNRLASLKRLEEMLSFCLVLWDRTTSTCMVKASISYLWAVGLKRHNAIRDRIVAIWSSTEKWYHSTSKIFYEFLFCFDVKFSCLFTRSSKSSKVKLLFFSHIN